MISCFQKFMPITFLKYSTISGFVFDFWDRIDLSLSPSLPPSYYFSFSLQEVNNYTFESEPSMLKKKILKHISPVGFV